MPSKTTKKKAKIKQVLSRGKIDLLAGKINPRSIRFGLASGKYAMEPGNPPGPPVEWRDWKRERFSFSISAAWHFVRGGEIERIKDRVGKPNVSKQRIAQMVNEGLKFLLSRQFIYEVPSERKLR